MTDHIAIMKRSWKLVDKILSGEKTIESRWYSTRRAPYGRVAAGDKVWFKETGSPVTCRATVSKVEEYPDLDHAHVKKLVDENHQALGVGPEFYSTVKDKRYCVLMHLSDVTEVEPFEISKKGFGMMSAWMSVDDICPIRR